MKYFSRCAREKLPKGQTRHTESNRMESNRTQIAEHTQLRVRRSHLNALETLDSGSASPKIFESIDCCSSSVPGSQAASRQVQWQLSPTAQTLPSPFVQRK